MAEAPVLARSDNGTTVPPRAVASDAAKQDLARTLREKVAQGYQVESESDAHAVLVMKGHRRWFGFANAPSVRYEVTVDEDGQARSRRL